jgi:hypothetical protein
MAITIEVWAERYSVCCEFCGRTLHEEGRFVLGLETPRSVQHALQKHYWPNVVFGNGSVCAAKERWTAASWDVIANGEAIGAGTFSITVDGPVVAAEIDGCDSGRSWTCSRVEQLARGVVNASEFRDREWHVSFGEDPNVTVATKLGEVAIIPISRVEIEDRRLTDEELEQKISAHLTRLHITEREGNA